MILPAKLGFRVSVERDGKPTDLDVSELTPVELDSYFYGVSPEGRVAWIGLLLGTIKAQQEEIAKLKLRETN